MDAAAPKPWQHGYPIEELRAFAEPFRQRHKPLVFGAFGLTKERDIAAALAEKRVIWTGKPPQAVALSSVLQHGSKQSDFAQRPIPLAAGSVYVRAFAALDPQAGAKLLGAIVEQAHDAPVWLEIFEEDEIAIEAIRIIGHFGYAASKIMAGSEIKGMYCTAAPPLPPLSAEDKATLLVLDPGFLSAETHTAIRAELTAFASYWAQHYSGYNKRKSWEAFALQGYDPDPGFIIKPAEMAKAWKDENPDKLAARPQRTGAADHFPATLKAIAGLGSLKEFDRVRFMRLRAKGGELSRHADITDRDAGTADGMICRLHIPISTSPAVRFYGWTERGQRLETGFPERALCYLDQRKPHAVTNSDPALDRVHLVVDCIASAALRARLAAA